MQFAVGWLHLGQSLDLSFRSGFCTHVSILHQQSQIVDEVKWGELLSATVKSS